MRAAVVRSFDAPPQYDTFPTPEPRGPHEVLVDVIAAGLHPRVRSGANGTHYTSRRDLPLVPGIDAVGRTADGGLLYFVAPEGAPGEAPGTMAEQAVADLRRAVQLPPDTDPFAVAAAMNPGMSSWVALRRRAALPPGARVLVLGATGSAGRLAVRIARLLGAAHVVAAGRDPERLALLPALGAAETVSLLGEPAEVAQRLGQAAADVDVVLDYVWGAPAEHAMRALLTARADRAKPLAWVQIGSTAGTEITLPSELLRAAALQLTGSGQGSVGTAAIVAELPALAAHITAGDLAVTAVPVPLAKVADAWTDPVAPGHRVVLAPGLG
ncbi:quinone oxidoreductase family protein [Actinacidiphila bryophytorum]|uniref:quinone oxidoreductase family protein n=1 Tax=Actinacidiphila bryophytorum TaxID=1436133 RepID=UPI002176A7C0|nr:zinc-binding alcohol dehydrogenase family protein [Actinacidiphila bryophytorum]UWE08728.1 zinc-binding alcohol dehydrogenase family protein [Actinacidiphila bryophytorum]